MTFRVREPKFFWLHLNSKGEKNQNMKCRSCNTEIMQGGLKWTKSLDEMHFTNIKQNTTIQLAYFCTLSWKTNKKNCFFSSYPDFFVKWFNERWSPHCLSFHNLIFKNSLNLIHCRQNMNTSLTINRCIKGNWIPSFHHCIHCSL